MKVFLKVLYIYIYIYIYIARVIIFNEMGLFNYFYIYYYLTYKFITFVQLKLMYGSCLIVVKSQVHHNCLSPTLRLDSCEVVQVKWGKGISI